MKSRIYRRMLSQIDKRNSLLRANVFLAEVRPTSAKRRISMSKIGRKTYAGWLATALACSLVLPGVMCAPVAASGQKHHRGFIHRHPNATAAAAGVGAYALAKHSRHGVLHRHPILTGIGAAAVAHHYAKKRHR